jgi:hypothetical protein
MSSSPVRIRLVLHHASFDASRTLMFERLYEELKQQCKGREDAIDLRLQFETERRGSLPGWLELLKDGIMTYLAHTKGEVWWSPMPLASPTTTIKEAFSLCLDLCRWAPTHLAYLPDDVTLGKNFIRGLIAAVTAQPNEVICGLPTHAIVHDPCAKDYAFYRTPDAFAAFAGVLPIEFADQHLQWRKKAILKGVKLEGDQGVNVHLMSTGRACLKTMVALVDHADADRSLDGSNTSAGQPRRALIFDPELDLAAVDWTQPVLNVGRTTRANHWRILYDLEPSHWDVEQAYRLALDANFATNEVFSHNRVARLAQISPLPKERPSVFIALPEYRGAYHECRTSIMNAARALVQAGIPCEVRSFPGQSLVTRCRNILTHVFMTTRHNVLVQWDEDVECSDPEVLVKMLATGHDVIGCAYPFRDGTGGVVFGPLPAKNGNPNDYEMNIEDDTCSVRDLATGLLMVKRHVLVDLMQKEPDRLCQIDAGDVDMKGAPHWALFDTGIAPDGVGHRRRYLSEDWFFSRLCRKHGYDPRLYVPPILRHWGPMPSHGHVLVAYGVKTPEEVYGAGSAVAIELRAKQEATKA